MPDPSELATARALAACADLPLAEERLVALAPVLHSWLTAANALSRQMAAAEHAEVGPVTVFTHPGEQRGEAAG